MGIDMAAKSIRVDARSEYVSCLWSVEVAYLRALAKRDMAVWRKRVNHENILFVDDKDRPEPIAKSEASYRRIVRAARTSPEYMERNT